MIHIVREWIRDLFGSPDHEIIRFSWRTLNGACAIVEIWHPTAPNNWRIDRYRCSVYSAHRLLRLAHQHPHKFEQVSNK